MLHLVGSCLAREHKARLKWHLKDIYGLAYFVPTHDKNEKLCNIDIKPTRLANDKRSSLLHKLINYS